jgi:hypothetical protein
VQAQCDLNISNVSVTFLNSTPVSPTQCKVKVNVEFDLSYNNGATFVYFNTYLAADYAALANTNPLDFACGNASTPAKNAPDAGRLGTTLTQAGKSFSDVGVDLTLGHGAVGVPVPTPILTTYSQDPTVALNTPLNSGGFTVTRTFLSGTTDHFVISGLEVVINQACGGSLVAKTDVWASNANSASAKAQCYICGVSQSFNDPTILGFKNCATPSRQFTLGLTTTDPVAKSVTYKVFIDMDDDNVVDDDGDAIPNELGEDITAIGPITVPTLSSSNPYSNGGPQTYEPYSSNPLYANKNLIIQVEGLTLSNKVSAVFTSPVGCIGLPVSFTYFTAARNSANVNLKWQTSMEANSAGFAVERNINGSWQQVGYVDSRAPGGNSNTPLDYVYTDINSNKGVSQYRIRQVDLDNKSKYSEIRSVRGEGQSIKTLVYPNPSTDGKVNIVFEEASGAAVVRDIAIADMSGRVIKQMRAVTNNNITIDNLTPGIYSLRIYVPATGEQAVEKIVVNKR